MARVDVARRSGCGFVVEQRRRRHDLAGLAVAALRHVELRSRRVCTGAIAVAATTPSIEVTFLPGHVRRAAVTHDRRVGTPSTCTVQAPHSADAAAELGAGEAEVLAHAHSSGASSGPSNSAGLPLTEECHRHVGRPFKRIRTVGYGRSLRLSARIRVGGRDLKSTVRKRHDVDAAGRWRAAGPARPRARPAPGPPRRTPAAGDRSTG